MSIVVAERTNCACCLRRVDRSVGVGPLSGRLEASDLEKFLPIAEKGYTLKGTAWIGRDDHLLYRVRMEGASGPDDAANVVRKLDFSRYDQPIKIELP